MYAARLLVVFLTVAIAWECTAGTARGQSNWSSNTAPQATTTYDRYGQPITSGTATISQQTQNTFTNAGNALREGFDAGVRAAEQTITTVSGQAQPPNSYAPATSQPAASNATRGSVTSPWPTTNSATSSAPTWSSNGAAAPVARSTAAAPAGSNGWSSIGTSIAAPPLIVPQSPMATPNYNGPANGSANGFAAGATAAGRNGPNFPAPPVNDQQSLHSVLTDPSGPASSTNANSQDWTKSWNNNSSAPPATISRTSTQPTLGGTTQDTGLVPVQGSSAAQGDPRTMTTARPNENGFDPWNNPSQAPAATIGSTVNRPATNSNAAGPQLNDPQGGQYANAPNGQFTNNAGAQSWNQTNGQFAGQPNGQMPNGQPFNNYNPANVSPTAGTMASGPMNNGQLANNQVGAVTNGGGRTQAGLGNADQPAWVPLVLAVLGLAASFAANLYLGASYLDARQKYQSLVRKTADTFRRVSAAAA